MQTRIGRLLEESTITEFITVYSALTVYRNFCDREIREGTPGLKEMFIRERMIVGGLLEREEV